MDHDPLSPPPGPTPSPSDALEDFPFGHAVTRRARHAAEVARGHTSAPGDVVTDPATTERDLLDPVSVPTDTFAPTAPFAAPPVEALAVAAPDRPGDLLGDVPVGTTSLFNSRTDGSAPAAAPPPLPPTSPAPVATPPRLPGDPGPGTVPLAAAGPPTNPIGPTPPMAAPPPAPWDAPTGAWSSDPTGAWSSDPTAPALPMPTPAPPPPPAIGGWSPTPLDAPPGTGWGPAPAPPPPAPRRPRADQASWGMTAAVGALVLVVLLVGIVVITRGGGSSSDDLAADDTATEDVDGSPGPTTTGGGADDTGDADEADGATGDAAGPGDDPTTTSEAAPSSTEATTDTPTTIPGLPEGEFPEDAVTGETLAPPGEDWAVGRPDVTYEMFHEALSRLYHAELVTCVLTSVYEQVDQNSINRYAYAPGPDYLTADEIQIWTNTWAGCTAMVGG